LTGVGLCADFSHPAWSDANPRDWQPYLCALLLILAIAWALYAVMKHKSRAGFFVLGFFLLLSPVLNILVRLQIIGADRFLYLPSMMYCLGVGLFVDYAAPFLPRAILFGAVALTLWYAWATRARNYIWMNEENFWTATLQDSPNS